MTWAASPIRPATGTETITSSARLYWELQHAADGPPERVDDLVEAGGSWQPPDPVRAILTDEGFREHPTKTRVMGRGRRQGRGAELRRHETDGVRSHVDRGHA